MNTDHITPLIITYNEAPNIDRTLAKLGWARQVLIVDSGSKDETLAILARYPQTRIVERGFDDFASQCNFGLTQISTEWTLSLDADYVVTDELLQEIRSVPTEIDGYSVPFIYCVYGHQLRSSLYPRRIVLYRTALARYHNEGHGHRVAVSGSIGTLNGAILHDDRKSLSRWIEAQIRYAKVEADHLFHAGASLGLADRIRRMLLPAPLVVFFYVLILRGCILDGWPGLYYALQRLMAETLLALEILDRKLAAGHDMPVVNPRSSGDRKNRCWDEK